MSQQNVSDDALALVDLFHRFSDVHVMIAPDRGLLVSHNVAEDRAACLKTSREVCEEEYRETPSTTRCEKSLSLNLGSKQLLGRALMMNGVTGWSGRHF